MGVPRAPFFLRTAIARFASIAIAAATVSADFSAATLQTIWGGVGGFVVGYRCQVERIRFTVGDADFAGAAGTLTFELRKNSATGTAIASITIPLATALRGAIIESAVTAANEELCKLNETDKLFLVRLAAGVAFTTGGGTWEILARQQPQGRV